MNQKYWEKMYKLPASKIPWEIEKLPTEIKGLLKAKRIGKQTHILDIGCGTGNYATRLAKKGFQVTGIDVSHAAIKQAKRKAKNTETHARFVQGNILRWKTKEHFDFVFEYSVFHHIEAKDRGKYAEQISSFLTQGSLFALVCYSDKDKSAKGKKFRTGDFGNKIYHPTREEVEKVFAKDFHLKEYKKTTLGKKGKHRAHYFLFQKKVSLPDTAIVMAAGRGIRMLPLTKDKPKALVSWKGKPLLEHVLNALEQTRIKHAVLVVGHRGKQIQTYFGKRHGKLKLDYVTQREQRGTADAVKTALGKTSGNFLVLSADVIVKKKDLSKIINTDTENAIALRKTTAPERYGLVALENGFIEKIIEKPKKTKQKTAWINAGIYKFGSDAKPFIKNVKRNKKRKEFELTDVIMNLIQAGKKVVGVKFKEKVYDIGSLEDLKQK